VVAPDPVVELLRETDAVLAVGASLTRHFLSARLPDDATVVQVTREPRDFDKTVPVAHPLLGDAALVLDQLLESARERGGDDRPPRAEVAAEIARARGAWLAAWEPTLTSDAVPMTPYRVLREFMAATDPNRTIVTHDSGSPRDQIVPFYRSGGPGTYLGWGKSHALGGGLGLILGAKLAAPDKLCVHFMGDAAFGMTGLDVETAVRADLPVVFVVLNNGTMAIEIPNLRESHERHGARDIGGDYTAIARALGADARRIERPGELAGAFRDAERATREGRTVVLEVMTSAETAFANRRVASW
jgi:acetolactate synthase-1/2/3 large subunit